jgi:hypothetical protein
MSIDEGRRLSGDDMLLQALLKGFALADRQANGFQSMVALLKMQDLPVGEVGAIITDDAKLKVNVHGRRHAGIFRKLQGIQPPNYPPSPTQTTNLPRFLVLSFRTAGGTAAAQQSFQEEIRQKTENLGGPDGG